MVLVLSKGPYLLLISVKDLHSTFSWLHMPVDESWSSGSCCCDALKPSKGLQKWDTLLRDHGLYSPSCWQVNVQLNHRACPGWCSHLPGLFVRPRACEQTCCCRKSNRLSSWSKHTVDSNINTSVDEHAGSVLLHYVCFPIYLNGTCS